MSSLTRQQRFESALDDEAYAAAWAYSRRLTDSRLDAEDLLQEALAHAYRRLDQLRDPDRFKGWLLSIVRTQFLSWRRQTVARPPIISELPQLGRRDPDPLAGPVAEALAALPEPQHEILSLFYLDGLSLAETGQVLGIGPTAVRQRLYRARYALRRRLEANPAFHGTPVPAGGDYHEVY